MVFHSFSEITMVTTPNLFSSPFFFVHYPDAISVATKSSRTNLRSSRNHASWANIFAEIIWTNGSKQWMESIGPWKTIRFGNLSRYH